MLKTELSPRKANGLRIMEKVLHKYRMKRNGFITYILKFGERIYEMKFNKRQRQRGKCNMYSEIGREKQICFRNENHPNKMP